VSAPLATRTLDRCLVCGNDGLAPLPLVYEFRGRFPLVQCRRCGIRFLRVQPAGEALAELYSPEYFESDFRCGRSAAAATDREAFRQENDALIDEFERWVPARSAPRRLLELGSAAGWLLERARERGWQVRGVELAGDAVAHARALGLEVTQGDLTGAALPAESVELVYMGDVLEHVPDCRAVLAEVFRILVPGGILYLRGPITTHSLARSFALRAYAAAGQTIVLREPPYHLWEFTPATLDCLLRATGLETLSSRQSKIPAGRPHGHKSLPQRAVMYGFDLLNGPLTRVFNALGDRITLVGRRTGQGGQTKQAQGGSSPAR